jgi:hypothetical protein
MGSVPLDSMGTSIWNKQHSNNNNNNNNDDDDDDDDVNPVTVIATNSVLVTKWMLLLYFYGFEG